jgi:hypothetical protein
MRRHAFVKGRRPFTRHYAPSIALASAVAITAAQTAQAANVGLWVLVPRPPESLNSVEQHGTHTPWFQKEFGIPYDIVEPFIQSEIRQKVDAAKSGTVDCRTIFCPDVDYTVDVKSAFAFTQKGQPVIKAFGDPQQNGVEIKLDAQMRLDLAIHVTADTTITPKQSGDFPIMLLIGIHAKSKLNLWPVLQTAEPPEIKLTLDDKNVDLSDLKGVGIVTGAVLGFELGSTPIGIAFGGPIGLSALLAVIGSNAASVAEDRINAEINKALNGILQTAQDKIQQEVTSHLNAGIQQANNLKDKVLNTPIPGIGKSYQELSSALGLSLNVQTTTPSGNVHVIVTPRFNGDAGIGKIAGRLRLPKEACVYISNSISGVIPVGVTEVNTDLQGKVGGACSTVVSSGSFKVSNYLGGNPTAVAGGGAIPLPNWKSSGDVAITGTLTSTAESSAQLWGESTGYYECQFEISGLPNADVVELTPSDELLDRLTAFYSSRSRYFESCALGQTLILDADSSSSSVKPQITSRPSKSTASSLSSISMRDTMPRSPL